MRRNKVLDESSFVDENVHIDVEYEDYIKHESKKPGLDDFTLSEYTEKGSTPMRFIPFSSVEFIGQMVTRVS